MLMGEGMDVDVHAEGWTIHTHSLQYWKFIGLDQYLNPPKTSHSHHQEYPQGCHPIKSHILGTVSLPLKLGTPYFEFSKIFYSLHFDLEYILGGVDSIIGP